YSCNKVHSVPYHQVQLYLENFTFLKCHSILNLSRYCKQRNCLRQTHLITCCLASCLSVSSLSIVLCSYAIWCFFFYDLSYDFLTHHLVSILLIILTFLLHDSSCYHPLLFPVVTTRGYSPW